MAPSQRNPVGSTKRVGGGKRRLAVCLAGLAPAVVTETLYALAVVRKPRVIPDQIFILTTERSYNRILSSLLGDGGAIRALADDYDLPSRKLRCSIDEVIVLRDRTGRPLEDIRTSEDSEAAGESIVQFLRNVRRDGDVELHCSIAGGRKTMGVLLALGLQLIGQPGDHLYHVLVNDPFERIPEFFYPPRRRRRYRYRGKVFDSAKARVELSEIPIVRLGAVAAALKLDKEDLLRTAHRIETAMNRRFSGATLHLSLTSKVHTIRGVPIHLPPQQLALYIFYASQRADCASCRRSGTRGCEACHVTDAEAFEQHRPWLLTIYRRIRPDGGDRLTHILSVDSGDAHEREDFDLWLRQTRSRVNSGLRRQGVHGNVETSCLIERTGLGDTSGERRRGLTVPPTDVHVEL